MIKPRVFVTQPIEESALTRLRQVMDVRVHPDSSRSIIKKDLLQGVRDCDYLFCRVGDVIDADVLHAASRLKLIVTMATAAAGIDLKEATRRKILVAGRVFTREGTEPDAIMEETADMAWAIMMAVARRVVEGDHLVRAGIFPGPQSMYMMGAQVYGKTLGIVGMGKIGRGMARRAGGFKMRVLYYDVRRQPDVENEFGAAYAPLETLLRDSDFVTLHPSYSKETHHLIGAGELAMMKPTAFLVNASRGPVVDQSALIDALRSKRIAGAALDVYEGEPYPQLPADLVSMRNVVLTPHLGSAVAEKREIMSNAVVSTLLNFLEGKKPGNLFNPEIWTEVCGCKD